MNDNENLLDTAGSVAKNRCSIGLSYTDQTLTIYLYDLIIHLNPADTDIPTDIQADRHTDIQTQIQTARQLKIHKV